jgi:hypothetical protein
MERVRKRRSEKPRENPSTPSSDTTSGVFYRLSDILLPRPSECASDTLTDTLRPSSETHPWNPSTDLCSNDSSTESSVRLALFRWCMERLARFLDSRKGTP